MGCNDRFAQDVHFASIIRRKEEPESENRGKDVENEKPEPRANQLE
jgi:hypothetical protein